MPLTGWGPVEEGIWGASSLVVQSRTEKQKTGSESNVSLANRLNQNIQGSEEL